MATDRQIKANQQNAQKSSGPRTETGKATIARNATKHGILSKAIVIKGEDPSEFASFASDLWGSIAPEGGLECELAERIIAFSWRLRRLFRVESRLFEVGNPSLPFLSISPAHPAGNFANSSSTFGVLSRYEIGIERMLMRSSHELARLQARRTRDKFLVPNAIDVCLDN